MECVSVTRKRLDVTNNKERVVAWEQQVAWRIMIEDVPNSVVAFDAEVHQCVSIKIACCWTTSIRQ